MSRAHFDEWGQRYLEGDPDSGRHEPVSVKVPTGPLTDILHAWRLEAMRYSLYLESIAFLLTDDEVSSPDTSRGQGLDLSRRRS